MVIKFSHVFNELNNKRKGSPFEDVRKLYFKVVKYNFNKITGLF